MTLPAHAYKSYGLTRIAYLVQCGDRDKGRLFHEADVALRYAQQHNDQHHRGRAALLFDGNTLDNNEQGSVTYRQSPWGFSTV